MDPGDTLLMYSSPGEVEKTGKAVEFAMGRNATREEKGQNH